MSAAPGPLPAARTVGLEPDAAELYLVGEGAAVARALGIPVVRSPHVPYGTVLVDRYPAPRGADAGAINRLVVGTHRDPQERRLELARREARRIVYAGLWDWTTPDLKAEHLNRVRGEELVDRLADATVEAAR